MLGVATVSTARRDGRKVGNTGEQNDDAIVNAA
jgi:hypothetical protein